MSNTSLKTTAEWNQINWQKLERQVFKLQKRIYKASQRGDLKAIRRLQKTLMKSWSARALAVRRVTQDNKGKKTAGVDGVKSLSPKQRLDLLRTLNLNSKVSPTRRVWVDKPGTDEKRPLGIPTMNDRALQALVKLVLEPEWEARFEPNSYGFRPGRSCHDAIGAIYSAINKQPKFILDADIAKCFDSIDHETLLRKLNTSPTIRRQIRAWLKAGVMDGKQLFPTSEGTPQGGVISPLLANIALHGMEERIKEYAKTLNMKNERGNQKSWQMKCQSLTLIRYADDFVILHEDITVVQRCRELISEWLKSMGLELKSSKTTLSHTLIEYEGKTGFDFLGFSIQQYKVGQYESKQGFKTIITPSQKKQREHYHAIASIIDAHKTAPQKALITRLNPVIRGWANYYSTVVSKDTYSRLDHEIFYKLKTWAKRRHPKQNWSEGAGNYWHTIGGSNWNFAAKEEGNNLLRLLSHAETPIVRHVKVKGNLSPYDGNLVYWSTRMGTNPEMPHIVATLLKKQKGKCAYCKLYFKEEDVMEIDHIVPRSLGGKEEYKNLQLLHRHCHDTKTTEDASVRGSYDKGQITEEPCEGKLSRTVLKQRRGK
ncbi:group II intron reverse transcriptase/maturase [Microcoleus sp. A006_D1]|uniref:group II intron reverse transcriptase/maturase n=1 Tax=Microcoleus sp. A006_D1 TaxID=3055267 RepID=UPI002FD1C72F